MTSSSCSVCPISLTLLSSLPLSRHTKTSLKSTAHLVSSSSLSNCWNPPDVWLSTTMRCLRSGNDSSWMLPGSAPFRDGNASDRSLTYSELRIRGTTNRWLTPTRDSVETCVVHSQHVYIGKCGFQIWGRTNSFSRYAGFKVTSTAPMLAHAHCSIAYAL